MPTPARNFSGVRFSIVVVTVLVFGLESSCRADLPAIRFDQLSPVGASFGTTLEVEIKGDNIEGVGQLLFDHPGLTAVPVSGKQRFFSISIAPDVLVGTYDVWLVGRFGVSNSRLLAVSRGLTDVADNTQNHSRDTAQLVALNSGINGQSDGNADDIYRVSLTAGQRITADCMAQRLEAEMDAVLSITTPEGRVLAESSDYFGQDPFLDFTAPSARDYLVSLHDLSFRGGQPYRLTISNQPQVENLFPAAVQVGQPSRLTAFGRNLSAIGGSPSNISCEGQLLDQFEFSFQPADDLWSLGDYRFRDHPTHHSVAPTAATCTLIGQQVAVPGVESLWSFPPVLVTRDPVIIDSEPNNSQDAAQRVTLPLVVAGRFQQSQDADWYEFTPPEQGSYTFDVYCERIAGRADPYLVVVDDKGNRINELDDFGHRINAFDGHLRDPWQDVNLEANRAYRVLVQDRYGRGGARYHYVLEVRRTEPEMYVSAMHRSNPNPGGTTIFKGTANLIDLVIHQRGNTSSGIVVEARNLPPGLHAAATHITSNNYAPMVLWADRDAPDFTGPIELIARWEEEGKKLERRVRPYARVWNNSGTSLPQRSLMLAIRELGPFGLRIEPAELDVEAGSDANLMLHVERNWTEANVKVAIQPHQFQGNFQLGNFDIPADAASAPLKIAVQPNTRPGRYTLTVIGQAQVPFHKDTTTPDKPVTLVATPSRSVTLVVKAKP